MTSTPEQARPAGTPGVSTRADWKNTVLAGLANYIDRAGLRIGGLSGGAVTLVQADQREGRRGEDGGDAAGGVHGIRQQVRAGDTVGQGL